MKIFLFRRSIPWILKILYQWILVRASGSFIRTRNNAVEQALSTLNGYAM